MKPSVLSLYGVLVAATFSNAAGASNCPPPQPLLSPDLAGRLVADVTLTDIVPSLTGRPADAAEVEIATVYAGHVRSRTIVIESSYLDALGGCGTRLSDFPMGTRLMIGVSGLNMQGSYGGSWWDSYAVVEDDSLRGFLRPADCARNDVNCYAPFESMALDEFILLAEALVPGTETDNYAVAPVPISPSVADLLQLEFTELAQGEAQLCSLHFKGSRIDVDSMTADIVVDPGFISSTGCPEPSTFSFLVGYLTAPGNWLIRIYEDLGPGVAPLFAANALEGEFRIDILESNKLANPETPAQGSTQSGIGMVRGWACDAKRVEIQFDAGPRRPVAYGMSRTDTESVCGDSDNGYGLVLAWGLLGKGAHTMRTFIDGKVVGEVSFDVAGLNEPFVEGLAGTFQLDNFPEPGRSVLVEWSEAEQNFIIVESQ